MVTTDDVLKPIRSKISTQDQEGRIRAVYDHARTAYEKDGTPGINSVLQADWKQLRTRFQMAMDKVKKETGL